MKLIKLKDDHYIIVADSEIKEGDWMYNPEREPSLLQCIGKGSIRGWKKITHSTQPLECDKMWTPVNGKQWMCNTMLCCGKILNLKTKPISLQEVKELIGEVDVEKRAEKFIGCKYDDIEDNIDQIGYDSFIRGYNQALEDNKEKRYTKEDVIRIVEKSKETGLTAEYLLLLFQLKTEWEVEFRDGKLKLI